MESIAARGDPIRVSPLFDPLAIAVRRLWPRAGCTTLRSARAVAARRGGWDRRSTRPATRRRARHPRRRAIARAPWTQAACRVAAPPPGDGRQRSRGGAVAHRIARPPHRASGIPTTDPRARATRCASASAATCCESSTPLPVMMTPRRASSRSTRSSRISNGGEINSTGSASGRSPTTPTSGSRNARLRCTGPGRSPVALAHAPDGERAPRRTLLLSCDAGFMEPADRVAVEVALLDGLRRADTVQLGRPVGGQHQDRHTRLMGLHHRGVKVGGSGTAGAQQRGRCPAAQRNAECCERGRTLVEEDVQIDVGSGGERQCHRRAARSRCRRPRDAVLAAPIDRPAWRRMWPAHPAAPRS